ncbi:MAG: translation elongation factor Ts [Kiritimatiellae bacterium]|nr:translation elongation factor Ts [Kiritimatiellia bacterium]
MAEITAALVKELRNATNVSMMECKRSLVEADGDIDKATKILRERGIAIATKKATRTANQGLISAVSSDDGKTIAMVEVNCETDFVAKNDNFINFVNSMTAKACESDGVLADEVKDVITAKVVEIGENIIIRRNIRYTLDAPGKLLSYIHLGGKVGVVLDLACEKQETADGDAFTELAKDLTLHIAACNPDFLNSDEVPADKIASEREIYANQVKGKPEQIIEKIVEGKLNKFFAEICLNNQGFVKEPKQSITELLEEKSKEVGDTISIRKFVRYQLGD